MLSATRSMRTLRLSTRPMAVRIQEAMRSCTRSSLQWPATTLRSMPMRGDDVAVLAVAVRGLVFVHKVHVDGVVGNFLVELRVQVQKRLAVLAQAGDPTLGRGECVHPSDDAGAVGVVVGLVEGLANEGPSVISRGASSTTS